MCGIVGIWNLDDGAIAEGKLEKFTDSLIERGPDGLGNEFFENRTLGLGHRRLAIFDLSNAGKQPMYYFENRFAITYNGAIYNFQEIRRELGNLGYQFNSSSDTEVILAAYMHWGEDCLNRFNGMWAFAIWDNDKKTLFLARDRFGIKPLYYVYVPNKMFAFASETRAFKMLEGFDREFDEEMLGLSVKDIRIQGSGYSIFKNIYQILPGHKIVLKKADKTLSQTRWWSIREHIDADVPDSPKERAEEFYRLFKDSCKIRLKSDVPFASALSGGLDSSSVYSTMYNILQNELPCKTSMGSGKAFVMTFPGMKSDERFFAEQAIKYTGGEAVFMAPESTDLIAQIEFDTSRFDSLSKSPITSVSSIYRGMKEDGITVSLDGHGADEMLYGYRDMMYNLFYHYMKEGKNEQAEILREAVIPTYDKSEQLNSIKHLKELVHRAQSPFETPKNMIKHLLKDPEYYKGYYEQYDSLKGLGEPYDFSDYDLPERIALKETFVDTLPRILHHFDRAGMMNGVEIRMPFLDWRLVSYLFSLPIESKVGAGFNKLILRHAMKGKMAENIRTRQNKIGFGSPIGEWFKKELKSWVLDILSSQKVRNNPILGDPLLGDKLQLAYKNDALNTELTTLAWQEINLQLIQ